MTLDADSTRCFGHRMFGPFRGVTHSIVTARATAVTTDGRNWTLHLHGECHYEDAEALRG